MCLLRKYPSHRNLKLRNSDISRTTNEISHQIATESNAFDTRLFLSAPSCYNFHFPVHSPACYSLSLSMIRLSHLQIRCALWLSSPYYFFELFVICRGNPVIQNWQEQVSLFLQSFFYGVDGECCRIKRITDLTPRDRCRHRWPACGPHAIGRGHGIGVIVLVRIEIQSRTPVRYCQLGSRDLRK